MNTHLLGERNGRFNLPSHRPIVIVLALLLFTQVKVLESQSLIGEYLKLAVIDGPSKLKHLFEAENSFLVILQSLIALAHPVVRDSFQINVHMST